MTGFVLSSDARAALVDIYAYTQKTWSDEQADAYLDRLFETFQRIADRAVLWRPVPPEFGVDGYFARHQRHIIYWKTMDGGAIGIVTIVHSAMMQGDRLKQAFGDV